MERGKKFYASQRNTFLQTPTFKQAWLTVNNVNQLISESGFEGEIDLFSLDIDGNDYHIMEAIHIIEPRVIICEIHNVIPPDKALTIPYKEDFYHKDGKQHEDFRSVSLLAMTKLLNKKGYRLVGGHQYGFNVVFIKNGVGAEHFPEVSVESVLDNTYSKMRVEESWNEVKNLPWQKV